MAFWLSFAWIGKSPRPGWGGGGEGWILCPLALPFPRTEFMERIEKGIRLQCTMYMATLIVYVVGMHFVFYTQRADP